METTLHAPALIQSSRVVRALRRTGGRKAAWAGLVLLVWAWVGLTPRSPRPPHLQRGHHQGDRSSGSPSLQVVAPISDSHQRPNDPQPLLPRPRQSTIEADPNKKSSNNKPMKNQESLNIIDDINPRVMEDKLGGLGPKPYRNQPLFHPRQLDIPEEDEEDEDHQNIHEEEQNGKWNGRNRNEDENNVAVEEVDDPGPAGGEEDDAFLEEVGGESFRKKKQQKERREKADEGGGELYNINAKNNNKNKVEPRRSDTNDDVDKKRPEEMHDFQTAIRGHQLVLEKEEGGAGAILDSPDLEGNMKAIEKVMEERRRRVREVCAGYGLGPHASPDTPETIKHPPTPAYEVFYIDKSDGLAWCPVYKAASTSWLYNFAALAGLSESYVTNTHEQVSHVARQVWPALDYFAAQEAVQDCLKFMIVRHPFERLVSAYRDKLENTNIGREHGVLHYYQKYGQKIVAKYRGGSDKPPPTPRYSQDMDDPAIPAPRGTEPTFAEFVRYLIDTDLAQHADDHWLPYYLQCTPCLVDYDVLAKFETLDRDQNYIIQKAHLEDKLKPSWKHLTKGRHTVDTIRKYFATISKNDMIQLYEKYMVDFQLFDYSASEYLDFVLAS